MNKFITSDNGGLPIQLDDFRFIDDAVRDALTGIMSAYGIAADESFILSGAGSTLNGLNYDIADGYISLDGEILKVTAHSIPTALAAGESHVWKLKTANDPAGLKTFESTIAYNTYQIRGAEVVAEVPSGVFMPMVAPKIYDRFAANGFGTILQTKIVDIGVWDMDATDIVFVGHGITGLDAAKVRSVEVMIIQDGGLTSSPLTAIEDENGTFGGAVATITTTTIKLIRSLSGFFDKADFDDAVINRGSIKIQYEL